MESCLYFGAVRHRRHHPFEHHFTFPLFMAYLDLDEVDQVFDGRWLWSSRGPSLARFDARDHQSADARALAEATRDRLERQVGRRPRGSVRLLTMLRHAGIAFNPISLAYCFEGVGEREELAGVVAEVSNTPWGERHHYVLPAEPERSPGRGVFRDESKQFHVSPFMDMLQDYRFALPAPGPWLRASIANLDSRGARVFDADLALRRREIDAASLAIALTRHPLMPLQALRAIYWQAFRLWARGAPFHPHPSSRAPSRAEPRAQARARRADAHGHPENAA